MKFIHTGDWHLGKIVNEFSMIEEQKIILEQLINIMKNENVDALVIAGDLYDRSIPSIEAVELLDNFLSDVLLKMKIPVIAISGNHDGGERLSFGSSLFTKNGLYISGVLHKEISKVTLNDNYGPVNFYLIPFADPHEIKHVFDDNTVSTFDDGMKRIIEEINKNINKSERNVAVAHGFISFMKDSGENSSDQSQNERAGLIVSESERPIQIGGTDLISAEYFKDFTYTALGHLHGAQKVGGDAIRYSGSILKYSFSEVNHKKGVTLVEIDDNGEVKVELKELKPDKDMRIIKGPLKELINPEVYKGTNLTDYILAVLTDEGELIDPMVELRTVYPNIMGLSREGDAEKSESKTSASEGYKEKSKTQLFKEFYSSITGKELDEQKSVLIDDIINQIEVKEKR